MKSSVGLLSTSSLLILAAGLTMIQAQVPMEDYNNARFGYHVSFPRSLLKPLPEADNGDGRHFKPLEGHADVEVYAGWVEPDIGQSLRGEAIARTKECAGGKTSYEFKGPNFEVISCPEIDGTILYVKIIQSKGEMAQLKFVYPSSEKAIWDPIAAAMSKSFRILGPPS